MHKLAQLSDDERKRIVADFLDQTFEGLDIDPSFAARMRSAAPELPDDPTPAQVDAWIELAELVQDEDFRARIRRMSEQHSRARQAGESMQQPNMQAAAALVAEKAGAAQHLAPDSPEAQAVVAELLPAFGTDTDREQLADRLATGTDARAERYWQLLAIINGWPPVPTTVPAWEWLIAALRAG
jgi:heat shock protein HspQ